MIPEYLRGLIEPRHVIDVCRRVDELVTINNTSKDAQRRIRDLMDGGVKGLEALVGRAGRADMGVLNDLPAGNPLLSGLTHLSTKLQQVPDLRVTPAKDTDQAKKQAETREHILWNLDEASHIEAQMPQIGMWLPGYGFYAWVFIERRDHQGQRYLHTELRDTLETFPGDFGVEQQPEDVAFIRHISTKRLIQMYPQYTRDILQLGTQGSPVLDMNTSEWSSQSAGVRVAEYYDHRGRWWVIPERNICLEMEPNNLSRPRFVIPKRFAFHQLQGQYDHVIGLMAMTARLTVMNAQWVQDNLNSEALELSTPIPTPTGWTTMGELRNGDTILGADGLPTQVVEAKDVQEDRDCYRVTFQDGTSVVASDGHLWASKMMASPMLPKIRTTEQMFKSKGKFRVPASQPWKLPEADLPIDPYLLGIWLGDGSRANATIACDAADVDELERNIAATGYTVKRVAPQANRCEQVYVSKEGAGRGFHGTGFFAELRINELLRNKHIPTAYLRGSIDQRLALVQGLMDSDGTASLAGQCSFTNTDRGLIDGLVELLRSLGEVPGVAWRADERARQGGYWAVSFTPRQFVPFRLTRKAERVQMHNLGPEWVTIKSIEKVDSVPVRCIAVDNENHLFLAGPGGHVTHNTNIYGQAPAEYRKGRFAINEFDPGTRVERVTNQMPFQAFQAIDRLERQLRSTARYPVTDDAQSPAAWATGAGLDELGAAQTLEIRTYQTVIRRAFEMKDAVQLEWEDRNFRGTKRTLAGERKGQRYAETYDPATAIDGNYRTRRKFGFMAGWDESRKLVGGLQLVAAGIIPKAIMRENLDGLDESLLRTEELIDAEMAEEVMKASLMQMAQAGDQRAVAAVIRMMPAGETRTILESIFMPEEEALPEAAPEALPEQPPGLEELFAQPQMLARMSQSGNPNSGGVQVMQTMGQPG